jgi:hypothetical protein
MEVGDGRVHGRCHCIGHGVCPINGWSWIPVAGASEVDGAVGELGVAEVDVAANVCLAVVSERLGHSSIVLTADTCSYLLKGVDRRAAEPAAALVPRQLPYQSGQKRAPRARESRHATPQKCRAARGNAVGPVGLEPTTCGLKEPFTRRSDLYLCQESVSDLRNCYATSAIVSHCLSTSCAPSVPRTIGLDLGRGLTRPLWTDNGTPPVLAPQHRGAETVEPSSTARRPQS